MSGKTIIFDMDGTLMDSGRGLMNGVKYTLQQLGYPEPDSQTLRKFVGPPIREGLLRYGMPAELVPKGMQIAVNRYSSVGKFEADVYPGIEEMLAKLQKLGHSLYVATSKPEHLAVEILEKFGLAPYFTKICGADWSVARDTKDSVIRYLLENAGQQDEIVMVGDTVFDVTGAAAHGIPTIGVTWGYGGREEMRQAGAIAIADTTDELYEFLK